MKIIRNGMFETNSSSTHVLCISKERYRFNDEDYHKIVPSDLYFLDLDQTQDDLVQDIDNKEWEPNYGRFCDLESMCLESWLDKICYIYGCSSRTAIGKKAFFKRYKSFISMMRNEVDRTRDNEQLAILVKVFSLYLADKIPNKYLMVDDKGPGYNAIRPLLQDQAKFNDFILNSKSYISLGGDEYRGFYVKRAGYSYDYSRRDQFENRVKQIEQEDKVQINLLDNG